MSNFSQWLIKAMKQQDKKVSYLTHKELNLLRRAYQAGQREMRSRCMLAISDIYRKEGKIEHPVAKAIYDDIKTLRLDGG